MGGWPRSRFGDLGKLKIFTHTYYPRQVSLMFTGIQVPYHLGLTHCDDDGSSWLMRRPPIRVGGVSFSPRSIHAKRMTRGTLSLSDGGDAGGGPSWQGAEVTEPGEAGGEAGEREERAGCGGRGSGFQQRRRCRAWRRRRRWPRQRSGLRWCAGPMARFESTCATPTLASKAVAAAKTAESIAHPIQLMGFMVRHLRRAFVEPAYHQAVDQFGRNIPQG